MQIKYKDININYSYYDNSSKTNLIFLHGWGQNIEMMLPIAKPFIKKYNVLIVDLPGFGLSDEPKEIWSIFDYADMVDYFAKQFKMKNPIIIGHSFGGKIALCYGIKYKPSKLVLFASPFRSKSNTNNIKNKVLKSLKKIPVINKFEDFAKRHMGSTDYKNATKMMRDILVKHVNCDLTDQVKSIKCPTLMIWGTKDTAVPYEEAIKLEELIDGSGIVTYDECSHYAYLERLSQTISVLNSFIGEK
ncbi:MAG: alpha/beta fold hydrolase [Bacilli bacterium]